MKITPDCVPCLMKRVLFQAKLLNNGCEREVVPAALKIFAEEFDYSETSTDVANKVHKRAYEIMGRDPYAQLKVDADKVAGEYLGFAGEYVSSSDDTFSAAIRLAVVGNIMDFGVGLAIENPEQFRERFRDMLDQGIGSDDTERFRSLLKGSKKILYFFDNCGESQFDKFLIKEIQRMGVKVVGVVRGANILNDVTMEDAKRIGLDKMLDGIVSTGAFMVGCNMDMAGKELKDELKDADMIVCKGMGNFESMGDTELGIPKVFILRTKCLPVAKELGVEPDINVVRVI